MLTVSTVPCVGDSIRLNRSLIRFLLILHYTMIFIFILFFLFLECPIIKQKIDFESIPKQLGKLDLSYNSFRGKKKKVVTKQSSIR